MEQVIYAGKSLDSYPEYKTSGSAGGDIRSIDTVIVHPHETLKVSTGLKVALPQGYVFVIKPRSSLAVNKGLLVIDGVIDSDYRGEISVVVHNLTNEDVTIFSHERIAQGIILSLPQLESTHASTYDLFAEYYPTDRGEGGFGSTGFN